ncbi:MAG: hypothetical protein R2795_01395 [Saprospiraceae bacterium]
MKRTLPFILAVWAAWLVPALAFAQTTLRDTVFIDFGNNVSPLPWNNLADPVAGEIPALYNQSSLLTSYGIVVFDAFNNINTGGVATPDPSIGFPATATSDSFFGNVGDFGGQSQPTGGVDLVNLDPGQTYSFTIFASRGNVTDNREAQYILEGATTDTVYLDAANNGSMVATITLAPDAEGRIRMTAAAKCLTIPTEQVLLSGCPVHGI